MRPGGQFYLAPHVVESVRSGNNVVLVGLQDVSVDAALERAGSGKLFTIENDTGVGAHGLQVDPVCAGMGRGESALPRDDCIGGQGILAHGSEVELGVGLVGA